MATTTEVRTIMNRYTRGEIYTNKTRKNAGTARRVKCYAPTDIKVQTRLLNALISVAGVDNVAFHANNHRDWMLPSITVACDLG